MKKAFILVFALLLAAGNLCAAIHLPSRSMSVARAGRIEDVFSNPAALPFRSSADGSFLVGLCYADEADPEIYRNDEKLSFFQSSEIDLSLSFGGRHAMFSLAVGYDLDDRKAEPLTYDMYFKMHFQLDLGYAAGPFSAGARLQGGSSLVRTDRRVESAWDYAANFFFSQFYENSGSEYFQLGLGAMWHDDWFTVGLYSDRVVAAEGGNISFSLDSITDSLSLGLTLNFPRFTSEGELYLLRPSLVLQAGNLTSSSDSYLLAELDFCFQLLPDTNLTVSTGIISFRNAREDYFDSLRTDQSFSLELELGQWSLDFDYTLPVEYYKGDSSRPMSFTIALRFNP